MPGVGEAIQELMFQFLLGRLKTLLWRGNRGREKEFQFLLGRLKTGRCSHKAYPSPKGFNSC